MTAASLSGQVLGDYELLEPLGKGGMGTVYLGQHLRSGRRVAVKVLHDGLSKDPRLLARFESEARALNLLRHRNIVQVLHVETPPRGRRFFVMEYLQGRPLSQRVGTPMPATEALPLLIQVCDGLAAAHGCGVVHRDLKPENVFLAGSGQDVVVKLLDFGVAKLAPALAVRRTTAGTLIGSPEYMSPEQCQGNDVDARADLYALGVISYFLATGALPFTGMSRGQLMSAHVSERPLPPQARVPGLPARWCRATVGALAKCADNRPASARALQHELAAALRELGSAAG